MTDDGDQPIFDREDVEFWQGRLDRDVVDEAVAALVDELQR